MSELVTARRPPFLLVTVAIVLITVAIFRLPGPLVSQIQNSGPLSLSERGWAFRLLAFFALMQAVYMGLSVLRPERVKQAREKEARIARLSRAQLLRSIARSSAGAVFLTVIYGIAAFFSTGFRSGFWLFAALALAQVLWYYRQTGEIAKWLGFQPETDLVSGGSPSWLPPPGYCPPIARGLQQTEARPTSGG